LIDALGAQHGSRGVERPVAAVVTVCGVEVLRESKATGVKLVRSPKGKLFVRTEGEILLDTRVLSWAAIAFHEAVDERRALRS
jgi:hypothetical protein